MPVTQKLVVSAIFLLQALLVYFVLAQRFPLSGDDYRIGPSETVRVRQAVRRRPSLRPSTCVLRLPSNKLLQG